MKIVEYDDVDPVSVFQVAMLALGFALTPEHAAHIRCTDPRSFPCLAVCAVEEGIVIGHVGIFRLPMITTEGREDVGGIWAVSTHPEYAGRGVASLLLEEAHARMRSVGLRFSTLDTDRFRVAYKLYNEHGYIDMQVSATAFARWETVHLPSRLRAQPPGQGGFEFVENVFEKVAGNYLGFAWRHKPFMRLHDQVSLEHIRVLWKNKEPVGYGIARADRDVLMISDLLLQADIDVTEAIAAVAREIKASYVRASINRPLDIASLRHNGYQVSHPNWSAFMMKPLVPEVTIEDARRLFGIGTDRFLVSWLDVT
jgi:GNAT superfamily N-acetyltransferase